jgi:hypothetical protein
MLAENYVCRLLMIQVHIRLSLRCLGPCQDTGHTASSGGPTRDIGHSSSAFGYTIGFADRQRIGPNGILIHDICTLITMGYRYTSDTTILPYALSATLLRAHLDRFVDDVRGFLELTLMITDNSDGLCIASRPVSQFLRRPAGVLPAQHHFRLVLVQIDKYKCSMRVKIYIDMAL